MIDALTEDEIEKVRLSVRSFGFGLLPGPIAPAVLAALQQEATERKSEALVAEQSADLKYRANITSLGPRAHDFLCSRQMLELLSVIFGGSFALTKDRSCLTFYAEGDHLGPHVDRPAEECAVTIIVYVAAAGPAAGASPTGLELRIYGQEMTENAEARLTIPTRTGGIVVGRGSMFWHERPRLQQGEQVAALTGCYGCATNAGDDAGRLANPTNAPIPLDPSFLAVHGRERTAAEVRRIVCSVKFELLEQANAIRLLGPEMSYHLVDPHLPGVLSKFGAGLTLADILSYKSSTQDFDLCFEDSWTGYLIAKRLREHGPSGALVLIHLDDHTDMMPALLCEARGTLIDPTSGAAFDPTSPGDWEAAIYSGAVNIGNFITPFYYSGRRIHVRHINNSTDSELCFISREPCRYDLIPDKRFAAIGKSSSYGPESVGTHRAGPDPNRVLDGTPRGCTLVHIDLDYFINDFNGASRGENYAPEPTLQREARKKMDRFFQSLARLNSTVDGWLIATSPGFCSAIHWEELLSEIESRIRAFKAAQVERVCSPETS